MFVLDMEKFKENIDSRYDRKTIIQGALINKVEMAYQLFKKKQEEYTIIANTEEFLLSDVKKESYRMLIINYLIVLLGDGKNDKISLFNSKNEFIRNKTQKFIKDRKVEFDNLKKVRNKVYAHFDEDYEKSTTAISGEFIISCINFITEMKIKLLEENKG